MISLDQVHTIAVCGAGTMGAGIAQVAAGSGYNTVLFDILPGMPDKARARITQNLDTAVAKGRITEAERNNTLQRIRFTSQLHDCIGEVIIEAIAEQVPAKTGLFNQLAEINHSETIFATNTSSLPVSRIAEKVVNPSRVAGMHFFNPAPVMKLVEVVTARHTHPLVATLIYELALSMGKTPVHVKDAPGFIVNRVARHYYLEALKAAEQGMADFATIDRLLESAGFRMGPFALMDLIGNDVNLAVTQSLYDAADHAPRFAPNPLQVARVEQGQLGRKSGQGFYNYAKS
ncbi:3-hydroxyacyl-CoA dehydrogenase NAD-binding domain-containing protein [Chitinophaga japonensis]|uniref:3-hydroxybutyryl-CoA dehydrogenase n=1 Tax=Chitinophaga japonensis TaxID=104662 RepID=A0A562TEI6_CHIJA|nr:3-hydroxyacyl-CoA dehydrogenase NAD-binding domain-containing protein [Chitinophaga japonensis]TWI91674.1 3-hydroxybutyryl-CoA dehydrogenase [Chitinophaga japonensis]